MVWHIQSPTFNPAALFLALWLLFLALWFRTTMQKHAVTKELQNLRAEYGPAPLIDEVPSGLQRQVLQEVLSLAWDYARNGIEGVRQGHILAVGCTDALTCAGSVRGKNLLAKSEVGIFSDRYDIMIEMNFDGAHIIDGQSGRVGVHKFFVNKIATGTFCGGAGAAAAMALSQVPDSVVFKVSHDGMINEYRGEEVTGEKAVGQQKSSLESVSPISSKQREDSQVAFDKARTKKKR